ncbi:MAG: hypothetical protein ACJ78Q_07690 [Chloroflexia bacterium]
MAESIQLYFHDAQYSQLGKLMDSIAEASTDYAGEPEWRYPKGETHVLVYPYDNLLDEFEDDDLDALLSYFNDLPTAILCIEIWTSYGFEKGCESAGELAEVLLNRFRDVVDDLYGQFWTSDEIRAGVKKETGTFAESVHPPNSLEEWEATWKAIKDKRAHKSSS